MGYKFFFFVLLFFIWACNPSRKIAKSAKTLILDEPALSKAHVGITIFYPAANKYLYNYQGDHYFVPASNTKIPTCYAAMKFFGDSLGAMWKLENDTAIFLSPHGDPTFLHPDFSRQPLIDLMSGTTKKIFIIPTQCKEDALGPGWAWNDYNDDYMSERNPLPVYGNLIKWIEEQGSDGPVLYSLPEVNWPVNFDTVKAPNFYVKRAVGENSFSVTEGNEKLKEQSVPFVTDGINTALNLISDSIHKPITVVDAAILQKVFGPGASRGSLVHSQPTDSLLKLMMHRSDNFFAEQCLFMLSDLRFGFFDDGMIIDTLLKTELKDLPQKPRWVDGSGLSRYNLFSPQDFVSILNKMKDEFGINRITDIFPTGDEGTLHNYYIAEKGYIFAKTGSLTGVVSISGFLYTKGKKLLIFSVLVNNQNGSATQVRRAVEKFIEHIRNKY